MKKWYALYVFSYSSCTYTAFSLICVLLQNTIAKLIYHRLKWASWLPHIFSVMLKEIDMYLQFAPFLDTDTATWVMMTSRRNAGRFLGGPSATGGLPSQGSGDAEYTHFSCWIYMRKHDYICIFNDSTGRGIIRGGRIAPIYIEDVNVILNE